MRTNKSKLDCITIVGRIPPPRGGVTVHLDRLIYRLQAEGIPYRFLDLSGKSIPSRNVVPARGLFLISKLLSPSAVFHMHASNPYLVILADWIARKLRGEKTAYSLHGEGIVLLCESGPWHLRILLRKALLKADLIVAINPTCQQRLYDLGCRQEQVITTAAYLPPSVHEVSKDTIPASLQLFLESHGPCIASQGFFGHMFQGYSTYRLDLLGQMLKNVRVQYPNAGLCTLISGCYDDGHRKEILKLRDGLGLNEHWFFVQEDMPAVPVYAQCDLFVRPTMTDGDSVSVRECLDMNIPVLASDAVPRPEGCTLFESGDIDDFTMQTQNVFGRLEECRKELKSLERKDHTKVLIDYYRKILEISC